MMKDDISTRFIQFELSLASKNQSKNTKKNALELYTTYRNTKKYKTECKSTLDCLQKKAFLSKKGIYKPINNAKF